MQFKVSYKKFTQIRTYLHITEYTLECMYSMYAQHIVKVTLYKRLVHFYQKFKKKWSLGSVCVCVRLSGSNFLFYHKKKCLFKGKNCGIGGSSVYFLFFSVIQ